LSKKEKKLNYIYNEERTNKEIGKEHWKTW